MKKIKTIFFILAVVCIYFIMNSKEYLNLVITALEYIWFTFLVVSIFIIFPASFVKPVKDWCSNWFYFLGFFNLLNLFINIRWLLVGSGKFDNLDHASVFTFFVVLFKVTLGAGFQVHWPLLMMIIWAIGCFWYSERLDNQYNNYQNQVKDFQTSRKLKYVVGLVSVLIVIGVTSFVAIKIFNKKSTQPRAVALSAMKIHEKSGMSGLIEMSQNQYERLSTHPETSDLQKCAWIDMFSIMLDQQFVKGMGFPENEYFNKKSFQERILKYFLAKGISMEDANKYLIIWEKEILREFQRIEKDF